MDLNSLNFFTKIVKSGGYSKAAKTYQIPVATLSRRVSLLEEELSIRLLDRSTRQLRLTDAGQILYDYALRGLEEIESGRLALENQQKQIKGQLRLSIPTSFVPWREVLTLFQQRYPEVQMDVFATDRKVDLIADGIDVALRINESEQQSIVARKLGSYRHQVVASPKFIETYGCPENPEQMHRFPCAAWYSLNPDNRWLLGGRRAEVRPTIRTNDYEHLLSIALAGQGIVELPPYLSQPYVEQGSLVILLKKYPPPRVHFSLVYPTRRYLSLVVRHYIDFCVACIEQNTVATAIEAY